jgi:hypothetical protein
MRKTPEKLHKDLQTLHPSQRCNKYWFGRFKPLERLEDGIIVVQFQPFEMLDRFRSWTLSLFKFQTSLRIQKMVTVFPFSVFQIDSKIGRQFFSFITPLAPYPHNPPIHPAPADHFDPFRCRKTSFRSLLHRDTGSHRIQGKRRIGAACRAEEVQSSKSEPQ